MKIIMYLARGVFVVCLPLLLLTVTIAGLVNCSWFYTHGFEKYDVRQSLAENGVHLTDAQMTQVAKGFIHYFNSGDEYISIAVKPDLFNTDEKIHFKDVKGLFRLDYYVFLGTFLYCLAFSLAAVFRKRGINRRKLAADTIKGGGITLGLMALMGIGTLVDFNSLFYQFHLLAFTNNTWSAEGNMLLLFPGGFWYDAAVYCVVIIALLAVILVGLSWIYLARNKQTG